MSGHSTDRPVGYTLRWYETQRPSLAVSVLGRRAYSIGRAVGRLMTDPPVSVRVTRPPQRPVGGSSLTGRGGTGWRTWSVTVSWTTGSLTVRHVKCGSGSSSDRSASGPAGIRTSGSLRSFSVGDDIIGAAEAIPVEHHRGPIHDAFCPVCRLWEKEEGGTTC